MATYQQLFTLCKRKFDFNWLYGQSHAGDSIELSPNAVNYPTLAVGFLNIIHPDRLHILGPAEIAFFDQIGSEARKSLIAKLAEEKSLGFVLCANLSLQPDMVQALIEHDLVVFSTSETPERVLTLVRQYIVRLLAPSCSMHGVFMDVFGMGILLSGQSGIGKSELGLELVTRGHGLVADDVVDFIQRAPDWVEGSAPALLANLLEVRGIGLLDIKTIFGETAVRRKMRLNLVAELKQFDQGELMERLPETELFTEVLGQPIRKMIIPVGGGRNLAVLVEAAVRSAILQLRGINTIEEFFQRQRKLMMAEDGL